MRGCPGCMLHSSKHAEVLLPWTLAVWAGFGPLHAQEHCTGRFCSSGICCVLGRVVYDSAVDCSTVWSTLQMNVYDHTLGWVFGSGLLCRDDNALLCIEPCCLHRGLQRVTLCRLQQCAPLPCSLQRAVRDMCACNIVCRVQLLFEVISGLPPPFLPVRRMPF